MPNFSGEGFYPLYLLLTLILIFGKSQVVPTIRTGSKIPMIGCWLLATFFVVFFAVRPWNYYFPDTLNYATYYKYTLIGGPTDSGKGEFAFDALKNICAHFGFPVEVYFGVCAFLYLLPAVVSFKILFKQNAYLGFLGFVTCFAFYAGGGTIIRNGLAYTWMLLAITLWLQPHKKQKILAILCGFLAFGFHHAITLTIVSFLLALYLVKTTPRAILVWIGAIIVALAVGRTLGFIIGEFSGDDRAIMYAQDGLDERNFEGFSHSGFRWDFLLYSATGIWMIYYVTVTRKIKDRIYQVLGNTYIIANAFWILFIYAKFSDRFARMSWILMPVILFYPLVKFKLWKSPGTITSIILFGQWMFLLLMGWKYVKELLF